MSLGKGRAEAITPAHMASMADDMGCHPADLEAIAQVESGGFGWFRNGQIKILPEPHKFYSELPKAKRAQALKLGLATRSYKETKASGHYKRMTGPGPRYKLLQRMIDYDAKAAYRAISVGTYQMMGFNAETCGFGDAEDMFNQYVDSEVNQLRGFKAFLLDKGLKTAIQNRDFDKVELRYNGGGLKGAYAKRMRSASNKLRNGKWKNYKPGSMVAPKLAPAPEPISAPKPMPKTSTTVPEATGTGAGGVLVGVGTGLAVAWDNGLWVLVTAIGVALAAFIAFRVWKRRKQDD